MLTMKLGTKIIKENQEVTDRRAVIAQSEVGDAAIKWLLLIIFQNHCIVARDIVSMGLSHFIPHPNLEPFPYLSLPAFSCRYTQLVPQSSE
jgi:hypothetical protein